MTGPYYFIPLKLTIPRLWRRSVSRQHIFATKILMIFEATIIWKIRSRIDGSPIVAIIFQWIELYRWNLIQPKSHVWHIMAHKYATTKEIFVLLSATSGSRNHCPGQKRFHNLQPIRHAAAPRFIIAEKSELNTNARLEGTSTSQMYTLSHCVCKW